jgi:hypothetical protein
VVGTKNVVLNYGKDGAKGQIKPLRCKTAILNSKSSISTICSQMPRFPNVEIGGIWKTSLKLTEF